MSTNLQDYVELLNAEQHVQVDKLRDHARHGIAPRVRGLRSLAQEVWMYLLNVLSEDKTSEITTVMALTSSYNLLPSALPSGLAALILKTALQHHTHRFFSPTYAGLISSITAEHGSAPATGSTSTEHSRAASMTSKQPLSSLRTSPGGNVNGAGATAGVAGMTSMATTDSLAPLASGSAAVSPQLIGTDPSSSTTVSGTAQPSALQAQAKQAPIASGVSDDTQSLRTLYGRFLPPPPSAPPSRQAFLATLEEVLGKFYHAERDEGRDGEYRRRQTGLEGSERDWVWLVTPFMCCLTRTTAVFLGFQKLMERMRSFPPLSSRLAMFLTLFKMAIPELFLYFEEEQVRYVDVGLSWVRTLFAKEMWLGNVMRLWDAYLAADDMFELHCYVCVAVLATCKETLEELDGSEARAMLLDLPPLDIDRLLQDAANLRVTFPLPRPPDE